MHPGSSTAILNKQSTGFDTAGSEVRSRSSDDYLGLLLTLQPEVTRSCILVALSMFAANTIAGGDADRGYRSLIKFFPRASSTYILAASRFSRFFFASSACAPLHAFDTALSDAKDATLRFASARSSKEFIEVGELVAAWTAACSNGFALLKRLQSILADQEFDTSETQAPVYALLLSALNGGIGERNSSGEMEMPGWAERRKDPRIRVRCQSIILTDDGPRPVTIRDISTTGVGLETDCQLQAGQEISITIGYTLEAKGTVVWANGSEAGVKLQSPIYSDDPRLKFCALPGS